MKQSPMETVYQSMMIGLMSVVAASAVVFPAIFLTQFHKYRKESAPKKIKLSIQTGKMNPTDRIHFLFADSVHHDEAFRISNSARVNE